MPRITVSIDESHAEHIDTVRSEIDATSDAEAVREIFDRAMNADARLTRLDEDVDRLEAERDELRRELAAANRRIDDVNELAEDTRELVTTERRRQSLEERRARAGLGRRFVWWLTGVPDESE
jgi:seryl-tRNA synthetase